jgi:hypothetical protein
MQMLIGCDPEVFLQVNQVIVPCVGMLPGTKQAPHPVPKSRRGLKIQEDGVTLEFNVNPVTRDKFTAQVNMAMAEMAGYVLKKIPGAGWEAKATHTFTDDQLMSEQAMTMGCDPDCVAWDRGKQRLPPSIKQIGNDRFAGGHIHFGYDKASCAVPPWAIIQFVEVIGYGQLLKNDKQGRRREFYGRPGLYREKDYGVDYRTPSNFWLAAPHLLGDLLWSAETVVRHQELARTLWPKIDAQSKQIQRAILAEEWTPKLRTLSNELYDAFARVDAEREE